MPPRTRPRTRNFLPVFGAVLLLLVLSIDAVNHEPAHAAEVPEGYSDKVIVTGLSAPTAMAFAPDGRIFVTEQAGTLRVIEDGVLLDDPFVTISVNSANERGLLGVAFDPDFDENGFVYVYYTTSTAPVHNRVSRFTADGNEAVPASEQIILELENLTALNHNGGAIHFGPDGKLYIATGENAVPSNAQTLNNRLGKILRINKDGSIPKDNPFFDTATGVNRSIWALGLRNPYTFAFHGDSGLMLINDVGQGSFEEINEGEEGANYGWPTHEGPGASPFIDPVYSYPHSDPNVCAITGGAFYDAFQQLPDQYEDDYFFADWCAGWIRALDTDAGTATEFATGIDGPVGLLVGPDGSLYYLSQGSGIVGRITFDERADTDGDGYTNADEIDLETDVDSYCALMRADITGNGVVAIDDIAAVAGSFGLNVPPALERLDQAELAERDGQISLIDISLVAGFFGRTVGDCD